jgi:hypothetical protein
VAHPDWRQQRAISRSVQDNLTITSQAHEKIVYTTESLESLNAKGNASRIYAYTTSRRDKFMPRALDPTPVDTTETAALKARVSELECL